MKMQGRWKEWTNWELWPFGLRYLPIVPVWFWYCIKARSFWFFTASNPSIEFGGFEGEGKEQIYQQLPQQFFPKTTFINPQQEFTGVMADLHAKGYTFPLCAKPDVGMKGLLLRKIENEQELLHYHSITPVRYLVQPWVGAGIEASVFYYRFPGEQTGTITGVLQKDLLEVFGDGSSTLLQLMEKHPVAMHRIDELKGKHQPHLENVLAKDQRYYLAFAANLNRGASFVSLNHIINDQLRSHFDKLSHATGFLYGRYDIKSESIADMQQGIFTILEYNGSGAEPNHIYQAGMSWFTALSVILKHWRALYEISVQNHKRGVAYWPFRKGYRYLTNARKHFSKLEELDKTLSM